MSAEETITPIEEEVESDDELIGTVHVLRGLPGVGKSEYASKIAELVNWSRVDTDGEFIKILSSDDFFIHDGVYVFDKESITDAHKKTFENFRKAIDDKVLTIIVDNTNIKRYHYYHYVDYAQRHNYRVVVTIIPHNDVSDKELAKRTPHKIDRGIIGKMRREFEWEI